MPDSDLPMLDGEPFIARMEQAQAGRARQPELPGATGAHEARTTTRNTGLITIGLLPGRRRVCASRPAGNFRISLMNNHIVIGTSGIKYQ